MNTISRYLVRHIFALTAIVALALGAVYTFISFVSEIDEAGQGGFGVVELVYYTAMMIPTGLYTLMPIIAMLGTLMGLGTLAGQNELTAMRAAGVSLNRIGAATLVAGAALGLVVVALGDWVAPAGTRAAEAFKSASRHGAAPVTATRPVWLRDGDYVFHIRGLIAEDHIADVEVFQLYDDLTLRAAATVREAQFRDGRWELQGVIRTAFEAGATSTAVWDRQDWSGALSPELLRLFVLEANSLTTAGLLKLIGYLEDNGLDASSHRLSLWRKIVSPFTVMAMMIFAVPFVLGPLRSSGAGQRLLVGILVGLGFYVLNEVAANLGQLYGWPPLLSASSPTVAFGALGAWRLSRMR